MDKGKSSKADKSKKGKKDVIAAVETKPSNVSNIVFCADRVSPFLLSLHAMYFFFSFVFYSRRNVIIDFANTLYTSPDVGAQKPWLKNERHACRPTRGETWYRNFDYRTETTCGTYPPLPIEQIKRIWRVDAMTMDNNILTPLGVLLKIACCLLQQHVLVRLARIQTIEFLPESFVAEMQQRQQGEHKPIFSIKKNSVLHHKI